MAQARRAYQFGEADAWLDSARALAPRDPRVRLAEADAAASILEYDRADSIYRSVFAADTNAARPLLGMARMAFQRGASDSARLDITRVLMRDSLRTQAYLLLFSIDMDDQRMADVRRDAERALAFDSTSADAHAAAGHELLVRGDVNGSYRERLRALEIDSFNLSAHTSLGNGESPRSYDRFPPELGNAAGLYRAKDYRASLAAYEAIAKRYPDLGLAHYGIQLSETALRDAHTPRVRAAVARSRARPMPAEPALLRQVIPSYAVLDTNSQKVVLYSVIPLRAFLPTLVAHRASYELFPFYEPLWTTSAGAGYRGKRTFDHRLWDDVKGIGGLRAAAGVESLREAESERYNAFAHEFMHQVHLYGMTDEQRREVRELYQAAMREHRTLDYYAESNEREYLAQAYEAFVSDVKLPGLKSTGGSTRQRLEQVDPAMFQFLKRITGEGTP